MQRPGNMAGRFDKRYDIDVDDIERLMNCIVEHAGPDEGRGAERLLAMLTLLRAIATGQDEESIAFTAPRGTATLIDRALAAMARSDKHVARAARHRPRRSAAAGRGRRFGGAEPRTGLWWPNPVSSTASPRVSSGSRRRSPCTLAAGTSPVGERSSPTCSCASGPRGARRARGAAAQASAGPRGGTVDRFADHRPGRRSAPYQHHGVRWRKSRRRAGHGLVERGVGVALPRPVARVRHRHPAVRHLPALEALPRGRVHRLLDRGEERERHRAELTSSPNATRSAGAGSTRSPTVARNGLASVPMTRPPAGADRPLDADRRVSAELDLEPNSLGQRRLDHLLLHLAVQRQRGLRRGRRAGRRSAGPARRAGRARLHRAAVAGAGRQHQRLQRRRREVMQLPPNRRAADRVPDPAPTSPLSRPSSPAAAAALDDAAAISNTPIPVIFVRVADGAGRAPGPFPPTSPRTRLLPGGAALIVTCHRRGPSAPPSAAGSSSSRPSTIGSTPAPVSAEPKRWDGEPARSAGPGRRSRAGQAALDIRGKQRVVALGLLPVVLRRPAGRKPGPGRACRRERVGDQHDPDGRRADRSC